MPSVKAGVVGVGGIGETHIKAILRDKEIEIVGITDVREEVARTKGQTYQLPVFADHIELVEKARPDYIVVCTPHYHHGRVAMDAMKRKVHVLCEKPLTVHAAEAQECVDTARKYGVLLGVNFTARMSGPNRKMHELVRSGFLGRVTRVTMIRTTWFRTMAYYRSSSWRATWDGEGGGVSVNQSPHDLDLLIWTASMPSEIFCEMNTSFHDIEVEDDAVALLKWPNGATGTLHITTNETPGRSFYEIVGTKGTLVMEDNSLKAIELSEDAKKFSDASTQKFATPAIASSVTWEFSRVDQFLVMNQNMAEAIRKGAPLACTGEEGLLEVQLANALLISAVKGRWVRTPPDDREYDEVLSKLKEVKKLDAAKAHFRREK